MFSLLRKLNQFIPKTFLHSTASFSESFIEMTRSTSIRRPLIYSVLTPKPSVLIPSKKMTLTHLLNNLLSRRKGASNLIKLNEINAIWNLNIVPPPFSTKM